MSDVLLSVRGLHVRFLLPRGRIVSAVTDASFYVRAGECLVLVGESGCGKSVLASALLGLLPGNAQTAGSAVLDGAGAPGLGTPGHALPGHGSPGHALPGHGSPAHDLPGLDLLAADERTLARRVRGRLVGLVPQSPAAHLTPVRTVRSQLEETVAELRGPRRRHLPQGPQGSQGSQRSQEARGLRRGRAALRSAAADAAERAAFPASHLDRYPHELSGGLAQRAATALALAGDAPLLLADEPTTGLDRDLVDRTVDELRRHVDAEPADGSGRRGMLMITHDLAAASRVADRVAVMYAGRIVEICDAADFFGARGPRHPYSRGLLDALPDRAFTPIPGLPPELSDLPPGCAFAPRCGRATDACGTVPAVMAVPPKATTRPEPPADPTLVACHHPVEQPEESAAPAARTDRAADEGGGEGEGEGGGEGSQGDEGHDTPQTGPGPDPGVPARPEPSKPAEPTHA
nr:ABC transporter ATP-binding protein [Streptomyces abyssomicinicus]